MSNKRGQVWTDTVSILTHFSLNVCITVIMYAYDSKIRKNPTHRQIIIFHNHDCLIEKVFNEKRMVRRKYFL